MDERRDDFVGRHLIVDASTYTRRNLSSTDTVFALFEALNRNLDMTAVLPPIVCRYPFANDEIATFCDDIERERELSAKAKDLSLTPVRVMREFLRRRQLEESSGRSRTRPSTRGTRTTTTPSTPSAAGTSTPRTSCACC